MAHGFYDTVTYDSVIEKAKRRLKIAGTTDHDVELEDYINEAVGSIYTSSRVVPMSCVKDVESNKVKLPKGFVKLLGVRFVETLETSSEDEQEESEVDLNPFHNLQYQNTVYLNYKWLRDCNVDDSFYAGSCVDYANVFKEIDGYLVWQTNIEDTFTKVQILYSGVNKDETGRHVIYERFERAVRSYACGMFASSYPITYSSQFVSLEMETWKAQKRFIKGNEGEKNWDDNKYEIQRIMHSMFIDSRQ